MRRRPTFTQLLLGVVLLALVVRVGYVAGAKRGPCHNPLIGTFPTECAVGDQLFYNGEANRLAQGDGFVEWAIPGSHAPPAADHPPLTVLVLAPVAWLSIHGPLSWVDDPTHLTQERYFMALLGSVLVGLIGLLGRTVGGARVGLLGALIAALYPNLWVNDGLVMSETVTGVTVVGALLLAYRLRARPRSTTALLCGAVCGLAALARAELVLFVPLLVVPAALTARRVDRKQHIRLAAYAVVAAGLVVGPWVLYNVSRFDETTFVSTNDGLALAGSNCGPVYSGTGIGLTFLEPPCIDQPQPPGDQSQVSKVYRQRAIRYMRAHASRVPVVVAARIGRTWSVFRPKDMLSYNIGEGRERWVTALGLITYYPLALLGIAGGWLLVRRSRRGQLWPLLVPVATVTIGVAVTYGQTRFRSAAEPTIVILAAVAIAALWERVSTNARGHVRTQGETA